MKFSDTLYTIAEDNIGLITHAEAVRNGIQMRELRRWVQSGRLEKIARSVYRVANFPPSEFDRYAAAVETIGPEAYLFGESVLALLRLVPTNPTWIYVASPKRIRRSIGANLKIIRGAPEYVFANYDGVRCQHLADAIRACRGYVRPDRRVDAVREGVRQGYISKTDGNRLVKEIKEDAAS